MNAIAYKFNPNTTTTLDDLIDSRVYRIKMKLLQKEKLDNSDKEFLVDKINCNSFSKSGIPIMGWMFSFRDFTKLYVVKFNNFIHEYRAVNKTSLRKYLNSTGYWQISYIVEVSSY